MDDWGSPWADDSFGSRPDDAKTTPSENDGDAKSSDVSDSEISTPKAVDPVIENKRADNHGFPLEMDVWGGGFADADAWADAGGDKVPPIASTGSGKDWSISPSLPAVDPTDGNAPEPDLETKASDDLDDLWDTETEPKGPSIELEPETWGSRDDWGNVKDESNSVQKGSASLNIGLDHELAHKSGLSVEDEPSRFSDDTTFKGSEHVVDTRAQGEDIMKNKCYNHLETKADSDELKPTSPSNETFGDHGEDKSVLPAIDESTGEFDNAEMTVATMTEDDDGDGMDDREDDEDFGDFASENEEELSASPQTRYLPTSNMMAFDIDNGLLSKLYPIPVSYPTPPPLEKEIIATTEARKTWFRLSQSGTLRKSRSGDDESYVRIAWQKSRIKDEVNKTVGKWIQEEKITGGGSIIGGKKSTGALFGWGEGSGNRSIHTSTASYPSPPRPKQKPRGNSSRPQSTGNFPKPSMSKMIEKNKSRPASLQLPTGTASSNGTLKEKSKRESIDSVLPWRTSSETRSPHSPLTTNLPEAGTLIEAVTHQKPAKSSLPRVLDHLPTLNESKLHPEKPDSSLKSEKPEIRAGSPVQDLPRKDSTFDEWDAFETFSKPLEPPQGNNTADSLGEWAIFDNFSSNPPALKTTKADVIPAQDLNTLSQPTTAIPNRAPNSELQERSDAKILSTTASAAPSNTPSKDVLLPSSESMTSTYGPKLSVPVDGSKGSVTVDISENEEDDEWGDLVQSPSIETVEPSFQSADKFITQRTTPLTQTEDPGFSTSFSQSNGLTRSNTLPSKASPRTTRPSPLRSSDDSNTMPEYKPRNSVSGPDVSSPLAVNGSRADPDTWDLSFFDRPSSRPKEATKEPPAMVAKNIWDSPPVPATRAGPVESEEDKAVKRILNALPDLSYMLP